jgi:hypothetical protein
MQETKIEVNLPSELQLKNSTLHNITCKFIYFTFMKFQLSVFFIRIKGIEIQNPS